MNLREVVFREEGVGFSLLGGKVGGEGEEVDVEGGEVVEREEVGAEGEETGEETVEVFEVVRGVVVGGFADGGGGVEDVAAGGEVEHSGDDVGCHAEVCEN